MKKILLTICLFFSISFQAQEKSLKNNNEDYNLFIAGGCHIGLWAVIFSQKITLKELPFNIHIDKLIKKKYAIGLGYSYDRYPSGSMSYYNSSETTSRHNYRLRFYSFLSDQEKPFSVYMGASLGVSYWDNANPWSWGSSSNKYWPTAQFLTGLKLKFSETFFWQTELGVGPPYAFQTSLGLKF